MKFDTIHLSTQITTTQIQECNLNNVKESFFFIFLSEHLHRNENKHKAFLVDLLKLESDKRDKYQ